MSKQRNPATVERQTSWGSTCKGLALVLALGCGTKSTIGSDGADGGGTSTENDGGANCEPDCPDTGEVLLDETWGDDRDDRVFDLAIDGAGNLVLCGGRYRYDGNEALLLVKLDPEGQELWAIEEPAGTFDDVWHSVTIQQDGRIVVAGNREEMALMKAYFPDGSTSWTDERARYTATGLTPLPDGGTAVGGQVYANFAWDAALSRYSSDGERLWTVERDGVQKLQDSIWKVATDSRGRIVSLGVMDGHVDQGEHFSVWLAVWDTTGNNELDIVFPRSPEYDYGIGGIAIGPDDEIAIVGTEILDNEGDGFVRVFSSKGEKIAATTIDNGMNDELFDVVTNGSYTAVVGWADTRGSSYDGFVAAYDPTLELSWFDQIGGSISGWDTANAVELAPDGTLVAVGTIQVTESGYYDIWIRRYAL